MPAIRQPEELQAVVTIVCHHHLSFRDITADSGSPNGYGTWAIQLTWTCTLPCSNGAEVTPTMKVKQVESMAEAIADYQRSSSSSWTVHGQVVGVVQLSRC
jgi:hypothetical protein